MAEDLVLSLTGLDEGGSAIVGRPSFSPACGERSNQAREDFDFSSGRNLLVASTGGHLAELHRLYRHGGGQADTEWVTFDSPQSRQLLDCSVVHYVPYVAPRDWKAVLVAGRQITEIVRSSQFDSIVSTGAAVALSAAVAAVRTGTHMQYIESIARMHGPSLTGKILARVPRVETRTQVPTWASAKWPATRSVLTSYTVAGESHTTRPVQPRLFVTLGTIAPYRFDSLIDAVMRSGLANDDTIWQLGSTSRVDLPGEVHAHMGHADMQEAIRGADLVITHGGVGTVLDVLDAGKVPVVVPRRVARGEHVDDHQVQLAEHLRDARLALAVDAEELEATAIWRALEWRVDR